MNTKLDNITAQYRKFNENQALTEGQLNEFIDYFEDQDRLSRTRLSGTGIVCGFTTTSAFGIVNVQDGPNQNGLGISQGAGVTTDGDLITLRNNQDGIKEVSIDFDGKVFTHYKTYDDVYKYPHFSDLTNTSLIELRNEDDILDGETGFVILDSKTLNGRVVLLYLESYVNEESPCQDADCDNQGEEQVSELRVLLVNTTDAEKIVNGTQEDTIYNTHNEYEVLYDALPNIEVSRAFLTAEITTEDQVRAKFKNAIERDNVVSNLNIGFKAISEAFNVNIQGLDALLLGLLNNTTETDFQYRYDLLKDLVATYNEIKNLLLHLKAECNPSIHSFPKHLMLGPVDAPLELGENTAYRHDFYKSPTLTEEDENYTRAVLLTNRFVQKVENFRKFIGSVRITPSKKDADLGDKAVPFYYNVTDALLETWDYENTENDKEDHNLSYHKGNLATDDFIQNPLSYNIDDNNFFRIEGHLGQSYKIAYENINSIKTEYGLPFDIKTIMLRRKSAVKGGLVVEQPQSPIRISAELTNVSKEVIKSTTDSVDIQNDSRRSTPNTPEESTIADTTQISIADLRQQLLEVSDAFVSNAGADQQETLDIIANLDYQLNLLNEVEALAEPSLPQDGGVTVVTQDPKDDEIESELLSDFMERHSGLEHFAGVEPGGTFILVHESEDKGQVIADFSLPYLCCNKKDPVFLVLPATELCQNDAPIPMTLIPLDGEIKAFDGLTQITGVTTSGEQNFFDPSLVPVASQGNSISFTVNDDPVETVITVHELPEVNIVEQNTTFKNDNTEADVVFDVIGGNANYEYSWNFGDGQISTVNPSPLVNGIVLKTYNVVPDNDEVYNVVVTITNRVTGCSIQKSIAVDITAPSVPCNQAFNHSGGTGDFFYFIDFGNDMGTAGIDYNAYNVPDRFIIEWDGNVVADSGFVGASSYNTALIQAGVPQSEINTGSPSTGAGTLTFNKNKSTPTKAKIIVKAPLGSTGWNVEGKCPVSNS